MFIIFFIIFSIIISLAVYNNKKYPYHVPIILGIIGWIFFSPQQQITSIGKIETFPKQVNAPNIYTDLADF